jgi:ADP-dependent NAD(P)H-hydrate dehydratase / NAD(P)H-hydrate epimerase
MNILSVAQMREVERVADAGGLSYARMMQNAGSAAAGIILGRIEAWRSAGRIQSASTRILILVGPGNNGGDGLVCARALAEAAVSRGLDLTAQVYLLKPRAEDDPVFAPLRERGIFIADAADDLRLRVLHQLVTHADVIVDALLGTGTSRPIDGVLRDVLGEVAAVRKQRGEGAVPLIVALDGVTGMNYDTGALDEAAVPADATITFHAPKRGHYCFPAAGAIGELVVAPIGVEARADQSDVVLGDAAWVRGKLPVRTRDGNKGSHGRVLVVGGSIDYSGAPTLAATAAYRAGAGLVTLAVPRDIQASAAALCREATFLTLPGSGESLSPAALPRLVETIGKLDRRHGIVLGPGMGQAGPAREFLLALLDALGALGRGENAPRLVVDADALNLLAALPDWPARLPPRSVLTPHPGEMARLAGSTVKDIQSDRIGNAMACARRWNHVVVLKGAYTVVAYPENCDIVLPFAIPAMATAGTGDVLTGCMAGFLAQGLSPLDAAVCGAYVHAGAGELWQNQHGDAGLLAGDLLPLLPDVIAALRR